MFQAGEVTIERVRTAQAGPVAGLMAQVLLLAALAGTVGLGVAGWIVGLICAVITNLALLRALVRYDCDRLGLADWVTLTRGSLAVGVAALVADSFDRPAQVTVLDDAHGRRAHAGRGRRVDRATHREGDASGHALRR